MKLLTILFIIFLIPLTSAVTFGPDTTLNTSSSNSSLTFFTCTLEADRIKVTSISIEVDNATRTAGIQFDFPPFFNHTQPNTNFNCREIGLEFGLTCSPSIRSVLNLVILFSALSVVIFTLLFFIKQGKVKGLINPRSVIMTFIGEIIGVVFIIIIADSIVAVCP